MTLPDFERRLQRIDPRLRLRQRNHGDVVGIFRGDTYLNIRLNKGEIALSGFRMKYFNRDLTTAMGPIVRRGRKTIVMMLQHGKIITTLEQRASLLWGVG